MNYKENALKVQCHLAPDLPLVMADSIQLEQIALNLLRNGMDAVEFMGHLGELHSPHQRQRYGASFYRG